VDRAVLLARRLRHHLHAGVEDLVAGHHELAVPPPKRVGNIGRSAR
jgi:hypothetical protein